MSSVTSWTGAMACVSGFVCQYSNEWYSQCVPGTGGTTPLAVPTTSSTPTPPPASGNAAVDQPIRCGAGTTGGAGGSTTTVTSCSALSAAVGGSSAAIVRINGLLNGCGIIDIKSSKSVIGVGASSLTNGGFRIRDVSNVILRNLVFKIPPPSGKGNLVALDGATRVWIGHCDFSVVGLTGGKGSLVGHSNSNASEDTDYLKVTYHHNSWVNVNSRLPSLRFGTGHIYNSYFSSSPTSGINSRMNAQVLVENSVLNNVKLAIVAVLDSSVEGYAVSRGNLFTNPDTRITRAGSLAVPYSYSLDAAASVQSIVTANAGTGIVGS
ncbi:pectin lyase-like protein [Choiromyces venosus 120613-1]|uniref:Pectin lyase-like protein n=1 Tax=Choiromyces venosus 120613-1 TaxID=1336337 RepID=A0A3N4J152_9PEZI|nr:pectin lyase-like protein [Choiromyces venosus 120613-1]